MRLALAFVRFRAESVTNSYQEGKLKRAGKISENGPIGLGLYYDPQAFGTPTIVQTEDGGCNALVCETSFVRVKWYLQMITRW